MQAGLIDAEFSQQTIDKILGDKVKSAIDKLGAGITDLARQARSIGIKWTDDNEPQLIDAVRAANGQLGPYEATPEQARRFVSFVKDALGELQPVATQGFDSGTSILRPDAASPNLTAPQVRGHSDLSPL